MTLISIISGGQTGVDRAALDFALDHNISCGGWCPSGRKAEDGVISQKYPLKETGSPEYHIRTKKNVKSANATLILFDDKLDKGTLLTRKYCRESGKPCMVCSLCDSSTYKISEWVIKNNFRIINIAGPRESFSPGIYKKAYEFINRIFGSVNQVKL